MNNITLRNRKSEPGIFPDAAATAEKATLIAGRKQIQAIYFGFDPVTYQNDLVLRTERNYVFLPLNIPLELAGGVWSAHVFLRLYRAQKQLSTFLNAVGKVLKADAVDRCLYGPYLDGELFSDEELYHYDQETVSLCIALQKQFRETYKKQLEDKRWFDNWTEYHNQGFSYRYLPSMVIGRAIDELYRQRTMLEENNCWQEVRNTISRLQAQCPYVKFQESPDWSDSQDFG